MGRASNTSSSRYVHAADPGGQTDPPAGGEVLDTGSPADFRELFVRAYPGLVRTVSHVVQDRTVAEDVVQDAFIELLRRWRRLSAYERPDLWVRRVAIRKAQRELARQARRRGLERVAGADRSRTNNTESPDTRRAEVLATVRTLAPKQRAVVALFYLEDRPMEEIADLVGCSVSSGWSQLHTARKRLATLLGEEAHDVR